MNKQEFTLDRFTSFILTAIAILLTVIAVELWVGRPDMVPSAVAQIPDAGTQRLEALREMRKTNHLLEQILDHLRTKPIKVKIGDTDTKSATGVHRGKPSPDR